jgi:digeranylgeranylglycerophospholipid reductase
MGYSQERQFIQCRSDLYKNREPEKKNLDDFISRKKFNIIKIRKTFGGRITSSGPLPVTFSTGLLIIGDAAGFTSPLFEGGTHFALKSGCIPIKYKILL